MLPALGGRLISLRSGEREFLWRDRALLDDGFRRRAPVVPAPPGAPMSAWQNWGGDKSWPAPQARAGRAGGWHGPPDPVLDGGRYRIVSQDAGRGIRLRSEVDDRTGLQQTREITLDDAGAVVVETTITNRSDVTVRFAPWEVMQVAVTAEDEADGAIEVERRKGGRVISLGRYWGLPRVSEHEEALEVRFGHAVAKLGFPGATGAVRCRFADGAVLRLSFTGSPAAPDGSPFQVWLQTPLEHAPSGLDGWRPQHRLVELEPVGALRDLTPGASASLTATWSAVVGTTRGRQRVPMRRGAAAGRASQPGSSSTR